MAAKAKILSNFFLFPYYNYKHVKYIATAYFLAGLSKWSWERASVVAEKNQSVHTQLSLETTLRAISALGSCVFVE